MTSILERPLLSLDHSEQMDPNAVVRLSRLAGELGIRLSIPDSAGFRRVYYPSPEEVTSEYNKDAIDPVSTVAGLWIPAITRNAARRYANQDPERRRGVTRVVGKLLERAERIEPGERHWLAGYVLRDPRTPDNVLGLDAENASILASHSDDLHTLGVHAGIEAFRDYTTAVHKAQ